MGVAVDEARQRLLDEVATLAVLPEGLPRDRAAAADLVARYFRSVGVDDLVARRPSDLAAMVTSHARAGATRPRGADVVEIVGPGAIDIVTDDMPFLVDSVTGALLRLGRSLSLIVHPQLRVRRDEQSSLQAVVDDHDTDPEAIVESWMHLEFEPLPADDLTALALSLRDVLGDVRLSVADWVAMRDRALALADSVGRDPAPGISDADVSDAQELLRWLADDNFTFVGYREYALGAEGDGDSLEAVDDTALGVMRHDQATSTSFAKLSPEARVIALEPHLLVLTKANRRSTVHRPVYLDYVGVKKLDEAGRVVGEHRFVGLYAATAYSQSVTEIPVVRRKVEQVVQRASLPPASHDGRDLMQFLETYPRDELFEIEVDQLFDFAIQMLQLQERRQTRLFLRYDAFGRFASAIVYLPRDRYTTTVRERMQGQLRESFEAESIDFTARVSESVLARLHFLVRVETGRLLPRVDTAELERRLEDATKSWDDHFREAVDAAMSPAEGAVFAASYEGGFPEAYKEDFSAEAGLADTRLLSSLGVGRSMAVQMYRTPGVAEDVAERRFKVYRVGAAMSLSEMLPVLQNLGVGVVDERPYAIRRVGHEPGWIYDFGLTLPPSGVESASVGLERRFGEAFTAAWESRIDRDGFAALVVSAGLDWRQVALVQTLMAYARQLGTPFSQRYSEQVLCLHAELVRDLVEVFEGRCDPQRRDDGDDGALVGSIRKRLDAIASLDEDRIVRSLLSIVLAVVRTNMYQRGDDGSGPEVIAVKLLPRTIPDAPAPRPEFEIWVHSPRVSGVHLRFGRVARGGLRWSDRREDFRTEVLGLVKAQMVKNAVIVPVGAKGGFVCSATVDPTDREAVLAEGIACYRLFVSALLDVTDNLVNGVVQPPLQVVRRDGDDPYLVVAADKGTATFSDIANAISLEHGFWLGDAFASGGSAGYDHKEMGITARGAWESVSRHFRGLGVDVRHEGFRVVGIGDMSGDVFGNGMLLSEHLQLVAAFDHRHVFIDPEPDASRSFHERRRLFDLPRSSWADYDPALISAGGGVFARSAKFIPVSAQMRQLLDLGEEVVELAPNDLLGAILRARVDLLWNGGIGTYVKARGESHLDVGDKANDGIRVNGDQLRCRVVAEGGNLGLTQLGRVEAAQAGVLLNTDAIDNSAGVDTSDHEVNIKVLLDAAVRDGSLAADDRTPLLESMTHDVARLVLADNYQQNLMLAVDEQQVGSMLSVHRRLLQSLEETADLDRILEALPSEVELERRAALGLGLVAPELCVLAAHVKIALTADLLPAGLSREPWFARLLRDYFPEAVVSAFGERLLSHPLSDEIVSTMTSNDMINRGGVSYPFRVAEETGAAAIDIARGFRVATEVFGLHEVWRRIEELDSSAPAQVQADLLLEARRLLDRATRWTLQTRGGAVDVDAEVATFRDEVRRLAPLVPGLLRGAEARRLAARVDALVDAGAPRELATDVAVLLDLFSLLDVIEIARKVGEDPASVTDLYFAVSERFGGDLLLLRITALTRTDRWSSLARAALRSDLYTALAALTSRILRSTPAGLEPAERIDRWEAGQSEGVRRARGTLAEITALDSADIAALSVALRALRALVAQGGSGGTATGNG
ncbi:MAG: NAD-glutamate dehydrogenase [Actinobacteria bacterium]|nr:NAD-glutamate dehydrogenase [Actinomycetota bacterium]